MKADYYFLNSFLRTNSRHLLRIRFLFLPTAVKLVVGCQEEGNAMGGLFWWQSGGIRSFKTVIVNLL